MYCTFFRTPHIVAKVTDSMLSEDNNLLWTIGDQLYAIFQLFEDYHTLKPDGPESLKKTQSSLEIDSKFHSEQKVHLFIIIQVELLTSEWEKEMYLD